MKFGVEINDILGLFNGALESDFETASLSGDQVILREIQLASEDVLSYLDATVLDMLQNGLYPHLVSVTDGTIELLTETGEIDLRVWNPYGGNCGINYSDQYNSLNPARCNVDFNLLTEFTDYTIDGTTVTLGPSYTDQELVITYRVEDLPLPSLSRYIRNKAACLLSHVLYTAGNDTWALTDELCKQATAWETKYETKKFIPPELRNLKWINGSPFSMGIYSIKSRRV